jgi:hypothetical protein
MGRRHGLADALLTDHGQCRPSRPVFLRVPSPLSRAAIAAAVLKDDPVPRSDPH